MHCALNRRLVDCTWWRHTSYATHGMKSVVPSKCSHIEVSIIKHKLGESIKVIEELTNRYETVFKPLDLPVIICKTDATEDVYQLTGGILAMYVQCYGK